MALSPELQEHAALYRELRNKDIFSGAGETAAAVADIIGGRTSASALIARNAGAVSEAERSKAKNDLLKTLSDYQAKRREDLRSRDKDRLDFLKEQYGNVTGERKWAMEQIVELRKQEMQGRSQVTAARLNKLAAEMADSDRQLQQGGFREARTGSQRRALVDSATLIRVDDYAAAMSNMRGTDDLHPTTVVSQFEAIVGSVPDGQAEHVAEHLINVVPEFEEALTAARTNPAIRGQHAAFVTFQQDAASEAVTHARERRDWQNKRDQVWSSFERQAGPSADASLVSDLKNIFNESPEDTTARVNQMLATMPDDIRDPAQERRLAEDDFTRNIREQLDRLDDPRFMFAGSRHERMRNEIMNSPEFRQYMLEKGDGGMISPDQAFTMMLEETKNGLTAAPKTTASLVNADAMALGPAVAQAAIPMGGPAGTAMQAALALPPVKQALQTSRQWKSPEQARRRELLQNLGSDSDVTPAEGTRDSGIAASSSQEQTRRLRDVVRNEGE